MTNLKVRRKRIVVIVDVGKVRRFHFSCKALQTCLVGNVIEKCKGTAQDRT
jgi:hypothetical protein